jgi:hypothetical protein
MAVPLFPMVGSAFYRIQHRLYCWSPGIENFREVRIMLKDLMYPRVGYWILHAAAIVLMFLLGYSIHFK